MAASLTQLTGGSFQDANGNVLAFGYLTLKLSQDGNVSGVGNICSGVAITIQLDANGNVGSSTSPTPVANQYVWANSNIAPINTYYKVTGFTQQGERAFGPNNQQVASGSTFNLDSWTPNTVISWFPTLPQFLTLQINGAPASSQIIQNLENSATVTVVDNGGGNISFAGASSPSFGGNGAFFYGPALTEHPFALINLATISTCEVNGSFVSSAGTVIVYLFQMLDEFTISKCSEQASDNAGGHTSAFGIYDINGNLVVNGGSFNSLTSPLVQTNSFSPVTLNPGLYWHAQACNRTGVAAGFTGIYLNPGTGFAYFANTFNQNAVRWATAANLASDGPNNPQGNPTTALPATLGVLTPFTPQGTVDGVCIPLWE
jgi:hypothetical protein